MAKKKELTISQATKLVEKAAKKIVVIQWYDKETTEELLDRKLTKEEYQKIVDYVSEGTLFDSDTFYHYAKDALGE